MSYFGRVRPCKHGKSVQNCMICRSRTKPLSKAAIKQAQQILTGHLQPIGGTKCLCHKKRSPITREQATKRLKKDMAIMAKYTVVG